MMNIGLNCILHSIVYSQLVRGRVLQHPKNSPWIHPCNECVQDNVGTKQQNNTKKLNDTSQSHKGCTAQQLADLIGVLPVAANNSGPTFQAYR